MSEIKLLLSPRDSKRIVKRSHKLSPLLLFYMMFTVVWSEGSGR